MLGGGRGHNLAFLADNLEARAVMGLFIEPFKTSRLQSLFILPDALKASQTLNLVIALRNAHRRLETKTDIGLGAHGLDHDSVDARLS